MFILLYTRPRTDVVKKGWYLGKRAKGIDIGLQGACKGEIRNITIPPHLMFGIEKDSEFIALTVIYVAHARYMLQMISEPGFSNFFYTL